MALSNRNVHRIIVSMLLACMLNACGGGGGSGDLDFVASVELWVRKVGIDGRVDVQYHVESRAAYLWHFCSVYILL